MMSENITDEWVIVASGTLVLNGTQYMMKWGGNHHTIAVFWQDHEIAGTDSLEDGKRIVAAHRAQLIAFGHTP